MTEHFPPAFPATTLFSRPSVMVRYRMELILPTHHPAVRAPSRTTATSDHINRVRCNPNIHLVESLLQLFLKILEELPVLGFIRNIHEESREMILVNGGCMFPIAAQHLRLPRSRPELFS